MEDKSKKEIYKKWWFWVLIVVVLFIIIGLSSSFNSNQSQSTNTAPVSTKANTTNSSSTKIATPAKTTSTASSKNDIVNNQSDTPIPVKAITVSAPAGSDSLITEPSAGITPFITAISGATKSIDLVMYELQDPQIESVLLAAQNRGVSVRVLLNQGYNGAQSTANQAAYQYFQTNNVPVHWTPSYFALTHQKTMVIDNSEAIVMTLNFTPKYYSSDRDFAVVDSDKNDVSAIESAFGDDWNSKKDTASNGDDLVWSPGSATALVNLINNAQNTLYVENEEMSETYIVNALTSAAQRGVTVEVAMTYSSEYASEFQTLSSASVKINTYATSAPFYIHAKIIVADGTSAFVGSENFSSSSLNDNRELGLIVSDQSIVNSISKSFQSDFSGGRPFTSSGTVTSTSSSATGIIKLSTTGICHAPGDPYYTQTTHYTSYATLQDCLNAGGRLPKN